jgi:hypothetical protein
MMRAAKGVVALYQVVPLTGVPAKSVLYSAGPVAPAAR